MGNAGGSRSGGAFRLTITLMVLLMLVGIAGAGSLWVLFQITKPSTSTSAPDPLAHPVCQAYQTQNYKELITLIDPAPVPPNVPTKFDAASQAALTTNLQGLDTTAGKVTACKPTKLSASNTSANAKNMQYAFLMTRAKDQGHHYTCVMIFVRQENGDWKLSRASDFIGTQG
ncbi:MAG: hypothetical protein OJF49_002401 [Ktedonobacterales bacterium]|jgi:hypothetical protein|nr:MAG: hypothetical protein OJF49_002401 [Ktedonobacterales bacterium]